MKFIFYSFTALLMLVLVSCMKSNNASNGQANNSNSQSNQTGTICQTNDLSFEIQQTDSLGRQINAAGAVIDSVTIDSIRVVYRAVADLQSSLSKGSRIDSVIFTGPSINGLDTGITQNASIGRQADYANWSTGITFKPKQFPYSGSGRKVHVTGIFELFGPNSIGRIELQVYYIHHATLHAPDFDSYDDNKCKLR